MNGFSKYHFKDWIINGLNDLNINKPTSIQEKTIPLIQQQKNVIGTAQTGIGKTFCYLLPLMNDLKNEEQYLILVPTKELVRQVFNQLKYFKKYNDKLSIALIIGNIDLKKQINKLSTNPQIIISTIGRFHDLMNSKNIKFNIKKIVLDEADMLIDYGFINQINDIFKKYDSNVQKMAFSATLHESLSNELKKYMKNTIVVADNSSIWLNKRINHYLVYSKKSSNKLEILNKLIKNINPYLCIIFVNDKKQIDDIYNYLKKAKYAVAILHKDLTTRERKNVYKYLNSNKYQYLIATDLASRGIDIDGVSDVISLGLPQEDVWYIHRSGRTGRMKYTGNSYVIYDDKNESKYINLRKKGIEWSYINIDNNSNQKIRLKSNHQLRFDSNTNNEIKKIVNVNSKKVKPGYKKKIKREIDKVKRKQKRAYLNKKYKSILNSSK